MPELVFVYGTLRRGSPHAAAARLAGEAEWLGPATLKGTLYRADWYPVLVLDGCAAGVVVGDVFALRDPAASFAWLDAYEGCSPADPLPHEYLRAMVPVTHGGHERLAHVYLWNRSIDGFERIDSGDWLSHPLAPLKRET